MKRLTLFILLCIPFAVMGQQISAPPGAIPKSASSLLYGTGLTSRYSPYINGYYYPLLTLQDTTGLLATQYYVSQHSSSIDTTHFIYNQTVIPQTGGFWISNHFKVGGLTGTSVSIFPGVIQASGVGYTSGLGRSIILFSKTTSGLPLFELSADSVAGTTISGMPITFQDTVRAARMPTDSNDVVRLRDLDSIGGGYVPLTRTLHNGYGILSIGDLSTDKTVQADTGVLVTKTYAGKYQTVANLQSTLTNSTTQYPSGSAVTTALATKSLATSLYGTIYNKSSWTNTSDFTGITATVAASGGSLAFTGAGNLPLNYYTCLQKWKQSVTFTVDTKNATTSLANIGIITGNSGTQVNTYAAFDYSSDANSGLLYIVAGGITQSTSTTALTFAQTDKILLTIERAQDIITATVTDLTTGTSFTSCNYTEVVANTSYVPNTGRFTIQTTSANQISVKSIQITSNEMVGGGLAIIGDSKTAGAYATDLGSSYARQLAEYYPNTIILAGPGDKTQDVLNRMPELLALKPQQVLIGGLGVNDILQGVSTATWQANLSSIVSQLQSAGIYVVMFDAIYDTSGSSQIYTYNTATFPTLIIPAYIQGSLTSGSLYSDNIHPTQIGHNIAFSSVIQSGLITKGTSNLQQSYFPNNVTAGNNLNVVNNINIGSNTVTPSASSSPNNLDLGSVYSSSNLSQTQYKLKIINSPGGAEGFGVDANGIYYGVVSGSLHQFTVNGIGVVNIGASGITCQNNAASGLSAIPLQLNMGNDYSNALGNSPGNAINWFKSGSSVAGVSFTTSGSNFNQYTGGYYFYTGATPLGYFGSNANLIVGATSPSLSSNTESAIISPFAKTDITQRYILQLQSNDASNPSALYFGTVGGASAAVRTFNLQTIEQGVANNGILALQNIGGTVTVPTPASYATTGSNPITLSYAGSYLAPLSHPALVGAGGTTASTLNIVSGTGTTTDSLMFNNASGNPVIKALTAGSNMTITQTATGVTLASTGSTYTAGTGLTLSSGAFSVNASQAITTLSSTGLTLSSLTNGIVKSTSGLLANATANTDYLPVASPSMTGTPTAPTPGTNINTTQIPTTQWVNTYFQPLTAVHTPVVNEIPSGAVNGTNTAFTAANTPVTGTVQVWYNGILQRPTTDYTISGATITFTFIPTNTSGSGSIMIAYSY